MNLYNYFFLMMIFVLGYILFLKIKEMKDLKSKYSKYSNITNIDKEVDRKRQDILEMENKVKSLEVEYQNKRVVRDNLEKEIEAYEESTALISMGV